MSHNERRASTCHFPFRSWSLPGSQGNMSLTSTQWMLQKVTVWPASRSSFVTNMVLWVTLSALSQVMFAPFCTVLAREFRMMCILLLAFFQVGIHRVPLHGPHRAGPGSPTMERVPPEQPHARPDTAGEAEGPAGHHAGRPASEGRALERAHSGALAPGAWRVSETMQACARFGHVDKALELFDHMLEKGVAVDARLVGKATCDRFFVLVANNLDASRMRRDGLRLFDLAQAHGIAPSTVVQNRFVIAWKSKLPKSALRYLLQLKSTGCLISRLAYFAIVLSSEKDDPHLVVETFEEMETLGIKADKVAFNAVLRACTSMSLINEARHLFMEMADRGLTPDGKTYAVMVRGYALNNQWKDAVTLFETMREERFKPDRHTYHHAICSCISLQRIQYAVELYNDMIQANLAPCSTTCEYLRAGYEAYGWSHRAN
ncbi:unnamed protein product [Prorocentrum cordatum]|uniref:Pentacotripeptide-repeat region of PRORP domain-containing protein n=1 Tax=Prorocentrum cordatum TaxID=2364126 RepID=A0ABN9VUC7_9DINO|nr:unnamed protein product [Polarella glacialis]